MCPQKCSLPPTFFFCFYLIKDIELKCCWSLLPIPLLPHTSEHKKLIRNPLGIAGFVNLIFCPGICVSTFSLTKLWCQFLLFLLFSLGVICSSEKNLPFSSLEVKILDDNLLEVSWEKAWSLKMQIFIDSLTTALTPFFGHNYCHSNSEVKLFGWQKIFLFPWWILSHYLVS